MKLESIKAKLEAILREEMGIKARYDVTIREAGIDSLDLVELIMWCESEFEVEIVNSEIAELKTLGDLVTLLKVKVG